MTSESQIRATFNDTKKAQEELRQLLDYLEDNNSIVEDRETFFELLANSLRGREYEKNCKLYLEDNSVLNIDNLGKFIRHLSYCNISVIGKTFFRDYNIVVEQDVPISYLWHRIKFEIFGIYPDALDRASSMSKELIQMNKNIRKVSTVKGYDYG